jgi:four helix bundle protein
MATIRTFEDIEAWKLARELSNAIYEETQKGSFAKDFSLRDQINRSSGSVMDNIAEGFERGSRGEFILFLGYAKGSAGEVRSQLYRAEDRKHIDQKRFEELLALAIKVSEKIGAFITYLSNSNIKGSRYKKSEDNLKL